MLLPIQAMQYLFEEILQIYDSSLSPEYIGSWMIPDKDTSTKTSQVEQLKSKKYDRQANTTNLWPNPKKQNMEVLQKKINTEPEDHPEMKRNIIFQTFFFGFHANFPGCIPRLHPPHQKKQTPQPPRLVAIGIHPILSKKKGHLWGLTP